MSELESRISPKLDRLKDEVGNEEGNAFIGVRESSFRRWSSARNRFSCKHDKWVRYIHSLSFRPPPALGLAPLVSGTELLAALDMCGGGNLLPK